VAIYESALLSLGEKGYGSCNIVGIGEPSLANPKLIEPNKPLTYRFALPPANHVFLPGLRIMV
jgi:hypothetical protein